MPQPVLQLLNVPPSVDQHGCAEVAKFVISNIGTFLTLVPHFSNFSFKLVVFFLSSRQAA